MPRIRIAAAVVGLALGGCAASDRAGMQGLTVSTTPPGARCVVSRDGITLGQVAVTPGTLSIPQGKSSLTVSCSRSDRRDASLTVAPHYLGGALDPMFAALAGGTGAADYAYPAEIHLELAPGAPSLPPNPPIPVTATPLPR